MKILRQTNEELVLCDYGDAVKGRIYRILFLIAWITGSIYFWFRVRTVIEGSALVVFSVLGVGFGILLLAKESYSSMATIDRARQRVVITRSDPFNKKEIVICFDEIGRIETVDVGLEFSAWEINLLLKNGESAGLSAITNYSRKVDAEEMAGLIRSYVGQRIAPQQAQ